LPSDGKPAPRVESLADALALVNAVIEDVWATESGSDKRARLLLNCVDSATKILSVKVAEKSGDWRDIAERHGLDPAKVISAVRNLDLSALTGDDGPSDDIDNGCEN